MGRDGTLTVARPPSIRSRFAASTEQETDRALTTVGRGIVFNALAVVLGFSVLAFSNFMPVRFFGFLVVVSIASCMLAAIVLMPPLVVWLNPHFTRPVGER